MAGLLVGGQICRRTRCNSSWTVDSLQLNVHLGHLGNGQNSNMSNLRNWVDLPQCPSSMRFEFFDLSPWGIQTATPPDNILNGILTSTGLHEGSKLTLRLIVRRDQIRHPLWTIYLANILNRIELIFMRDQNCHPLRDIHWWDLMGTVTWAYCKKGSKLPPPLSNILTGIFASTYLHKRSNSPPSLANILHVFSS